MLSRLEFFITETFISMRRHPAMAFAASVCIAATLFVAGLIGLIVLNVNYATDKTLSQVRFHVYYHTEVKRGEAWASFRRIQRLPGVASAEFIPKEIPWAAQQDMHSFLPGNPYPDHVIVQATSLEEIEPLKNEIRTWEEVHKVQTPEFIPTLINLTHAITKSGVIVGIILLALSLVIIHHTIELTLYARRREMFIMSLVGATPGTIALPFLLEGIVYGLLGAGVSLGVLLPLYQVAIKQMSANFQFSLANGGPAMTAGILTVVIAGAALGFIGSVISVLKYLRSPRSRLTNA